jgi:DNA-binding CsgD family transcriptional regulator
LDSAWTKKIYISRIADFNLMFAASDKLIIAEGDIDTAGYFKIQFPASEDETLYRLHVIRANDPVSTLIIGSEDENHVFFIAKNSNQIYFNGSDNGKIINQSNVKGGNANDELNTLLSIINSTSINRDSLKNQLMGTAEKSRSELVGLLAVYSSFALSAGQKSSITSILKRYNKDNPYGSKIFEEYKNQYSKVLFFLILLIFVLTGVLFAYRLYKKRMIVKISQSLSQRESSIVRLILESRTNKEIASDLNIELSTVKTHVNNIYAKLKIGNRKELLRYKDVFSNKTQK